MNEYKQIIEQKQKRRDQLLLELWKAADGREDKAINYMDVAEKTGFDREEATDIWLYFNSENLLQYQALNWGTHLSHKAILKVENSLANPKQSTEHFLSTVVQNFHAPVGAVQNASNSIANINQNIGQNFSEILEQLANLRREFQSLPDEDREEAIEVVDALAVEVQSETPSKGRVKAFLSSVKDFAVKTGSDVTSKIVVELIKGQVGI